MNINKIPLVGKSYTELIDYLTVNFESITGHDYYKFYNKTIYHKLGKHVFMVKRPFEGLQLRLKYRRVVLLEIKPYKIFLNLDPNREIGYYFQRPSYVHSRKLTTGNSILLHAVFRQINNFKTNRELTK